MAPVERLSRAPCSRTAGRGPGNLYAGELRRSGSVVTYAAMPTWLQGVDTHEALRKLLGRDWRRYETLARPKMRERFLASRLLLRHVAAAALETVPSWSISRTSRADAPMYGAATRSTSASATPRR